MIEKKNYVFDLENTLIYTDSLNNDSYNYALNLHELKSISDCKRINRDIVFNKYPKLNTLQKKTIIELKQKYFLDNLSETKPNMSLIQVLTNQSIESCLLWTSSDKNKILALLEYHNISNEFIKIFFSDKYEVAKDIEEICRFFKCDFQRLVFYEDNNRIIKELEELKLSVISV